MYNRIPDASRLAATEVKEHASKPSLCENECVDTMNKEVGSQSQVDATKIRKARKKFHKTNKLMEQVTEVQVHTETDGIDVNKKTDALEPCLSEHSDQPISGNCLPSPGSSPVRMLNGDVAEPFVRDNSEERPPRCSTPDILDNLNSRAFMVSRKVVVDRSRHRGRTSKRMQYVEYEDDMTLASFINQSRRAQRILLSSTKASKLLP